MSYISSSTDVNTDSNSSLMDNNAIIPVSSPLSEKIIQSPENSESKSENKSEKRQRKRRKSKKEKKEKKGKHKRHNSSDIKKSHENREEHSKSEKSRSNIEISEEVTSEKKSEIELSQNYNDSENSREIKINYQESVESSDNEKSPSKKSKKQKKIKFPKVKNSKKNKKKKDKTEKEKAEKDKIEKDKTKKDKKKKDKTEKEKAEKDNTEKDKTEKDNTEKDKTEKDNTEKDRTEKDKTKKDKKKKDKTEKEKAEKDNTKKDKKKKDKKKKDKKKKANKRDEKDQSSEIYDERSSEDVRISQDKSKSPEEKHKKKGIFHFGKKKSKKDKESSKSKHNKSNQSYSELNDSLGDSILIQNNSSVLDFDQNYDGSSIEISQVDNNKSIITSQIEYILNSDDFLKKFEKLDPDALIEELDLKDIPDPPKSLELPALTESEGGLFMPPPLLNSCSLFDLSEESKPDQNKSTSLFKFTSSSTDESENSDSSKIDLQFTNISTSFCESLALSDINMLNSCNNFNSINNSNIPEDDSNDNIKVAKDNSCSFNGKIESQQTPQKRTPNVKIVISRYFKEEYCYFLNIPYSDNLGKAEILEKIKSCENGSFLDFAQENFRKHHSNHSKVSKYQTIEELASFSDKPLYKPLLKSTSDKMREISHNISAIILKYAKNPSIGGHSTDHTSGAFAFRLLQIIRSQKEITAEAFIQLIKQTRNCPTIEYSTSFWNLTMIIASYFPVPESIKNIVFNYVLETIISKKVPLKISNMARFTFIRMYDRTQLIQRAFEREFIQNAIETMPRVVFSGLTMFSCSLYEMMWCQMRKYPNLPVPLSLHLIIRTIKKNGGLLRQNLYHNEAPNNGTKELVLSWTKELPFDNSVIDEADPSDLVCLLFFWLYGLNNPIVPKEAAEIFIEKCQTEHYSEIFDHIMPLHMNTLKYVIGFLKEVIEYQKYNGTNIDGLCELFGPYIVDSLRKTVEPFNRTRMVDLSPNFVKYCIENLDCEAIYPLKPIHEQMITKQTK